MSSELPSPSNVLDAGAALTPPPDAGVTTAAVVTASKCTVSASSLSPFDPGDRYGWGVDTILKCALDDDAIAAIRRNIASGPLQFAAGCDLGELEGLVDYVKHSIEAVIAVLRAAFEFFAFVYTSFIGDPYLLAAVVDTWAAQPGSGLEPIENYLQQEAPNLLDALRSIPHTNAGTAR